MLGSINEALHYFIMFLKKRGFEVLKAKPTNFNRHYLIECKHWMYPKRKFLYYLAYQREWFLSMPKYYPNAGDVGATLNYEILNKCIKMDVDVVVFAHSSGTFLAIKPSEMLKIAKDSGWIRRTDKTGETVVNIPISYLKPLPVTIRSK